MLYELLATVGGWEPRGEGPLDWRRTWDDSGRSGKCFCYLLPYCKCSESWHCAENILLAKGSTCQDNRLEGKYFEVRSSSTSWKTWAFNSGTLALDSWIFKSTVLTALISQFMRTMMKVIDAACKWLQKESSKLEWLRNVPTLCRWILLAHIYTICSRLVPTVVVRLKCFFYYLLTNNTIYTT